MSKKKESNSDGNKNNYFVIDKPYELISSGCQILDCVLGGGWPLGRISNVIGDASTNKTGLSVEAIINFRMKYPDGYIWYQDAEAAFDIEYARELGLPNDEKTFVIDDIRDIQLTYELILSAIKKITDENTVGIYVLDTLDAIMPLDETGELAIGYSAAKRAAIIDEMITKLAGKIERANLHFMVVSQIRENIGVMIGDKHRVSGGKALGFYASQRLWLTKLSTLTRTIRGIKRAYGIEVKAKVKKNKIGLPFRECDLPVIFGYGIDDLTANLMFLKEAKGLDEIGLSGTTDREINTLVETYYKDNEMRKKISDQVKKRWDETEMEFLPKSRKYIGDNHLREIN